MEARNREFGQRMDDTRAEDIKEKDEIRLSVTNLNNKTDSFRSTYDTFTHEATKLTEKDCFDIYA